MGSSIIKQGQIKPKIVASYLLALRSWHVDHKYSTLLFKFPRIKLLLAGGRSFFPSTKSLRLPITKNIFQILTNFPPISINDLNLNTAFKVAWAGFMRLGELTDTANKKADPSFKDLHFKKSDITFSEQDQCAMLRLKRSKTDTNHTRVRIMLAATKDPTCPVTALRSLFIHDPQSSHAPLFAFNNCLFSRQHVINNFRARLLARRVPLIGFLGHSLKRCAAQHVSDNGMLDEDIQKLGR